VDAGEGHLEDEDGADSVEEDLERAEEGLPEDGVEEYGFNGRGQIGIEPVDAEGFVVREMVWLLTSEFSSARPAFIGHAL
jgi:hypothetical protein